MKAYKSITAIFFMFLILCISLSSATLTDGLVSYYKLDESTGTTTVDSLNINNGTITGATLGEAGKIATAYGFVGTSVTKAVTLANPIGDILQSFSFWVNPSATTGTIYSTDGSGYSKLTIGNTAGGTCAASKMCFGRFDGSWGNVQSTASTGTGSYEHWVIIISSTNITMYKNGAFDSSQIISKGTTTPTTSAIGNIGWGIAGSTNLNGYLDEFGIWNRSLTASEITQLYNNGNGLAYPLTGATDISLISPTDLVTISDIGTNFTASGGNISSVAGTWKNITYYIWNESDNIHNQTTVSLNSQTFNNSLFIDDFTLGNYTWNVRAAYTNVTGTYYVWAVSNFSFSVVPIAQISTIYNPTIIEGSSEQFSTNISVISFERMSTVNFVYNGTHYPVIPIEYETNKWYMPYNLTVPLVSANTNISFYWSIRLESGLVYNTTSINQTVYNLGIDNCASNTNQLFNFTMRDETYQNILNGTLDNTYIRVSISLDSINGQIVNYSAFYNKTNPSRVCINYPVNTSMLYMDATIEFSSTGRFVEFYNIRDYILTNTTQSQNISLYNLNSSVGQEYKITYKGLDFTPVSDLLIQIQRKYVDEGVFKTIEIPASGTNGYTIAHLVTNDVIYNLIFIKDGVILDTFTDVIATCQNPSFTECEINLNAAVGGTDLIGLVEEDDFFSSLSYNTATRTISSLFGITSGISGNTTLQVYLLDNFGTTSVCSDSLIAAGGTLSCAVPSGFGNASVKAIVYLNGNERRSGYISLASSPKEKYAGILVFTAIIMLLFILGIAIQDNPMIMGVFLIVGLFILVALNMVYSTSWLGAGATALWFVIAVIMILIKGGNKR